MKIRTDFVTNSSSSSFVIAYKKMPEIDDGTLKKYPFLSLWDDIVREIIFRENEETTITIDNIDDLKKYIYKEYGYLERSFKELIKFDLYVRDIYIKAKKKLSEGYMIMFKDVMYDQGLLENLLKLLESDDFIILSEEG